MSILFGFKKEICIFIKIRSLLIKHMFPQCAPANQETSCLLEIGDVSRKFLLRCSCQFILLCPRPNIRILYSYEGQKLRL
jgi:hypothetical protein